MRDYAFSNEEIAIEEFLQNLRKQKVKTQVKKLPDGRLKVTYCPDPMKDNCSIKYFVPRYFAPLNKKPLKPSKFSAYNVSKSTARTGKQRAIKHRGRIDQKEVYAAIKNKKKGTTLTAIGRKFGIPESYVSIIKRKGIGLGW